MRWALVLLASCSTKDTDAKNCTSVTGSYTIAGPAVPPNGACNGLPDPAAFAHGSLVVTEADGGFAVTTTDTTAATDMTACDAHLSSCRLTGSCTSADGGVTKQSFSLEVNGSHVTGNLGAAFTTSAGTCTYSIPITGSR